MKSSKMTIFEAERILRFAGIKLPKYRQHTYKTYEKERRAFFKYIAKRRYVSALKSCTYEEYYGAKCRDINERIYYRLRCPVFRRHRSEVYKSFEGQFTKNKRQIEASAVRLARSWIKRPANRRAFYVARMSEELARLAATAPLDQLYCSGMGIPKEEIPLDVKALCLALAWARRQLKQFQQTN